MGSERSRAAVSPDRRVPVTPRAVRGILRNGLLGLAAVGVVVATHFGFPLLVMLLVPGLTMTLVGIGLLLLTLISILVVVPAVTMSALALIETKFLEDGTYSIRSWPWIFAFPSLTAIFLLLMSTYWIHIVPGNHSISQSINSMEFNLSSWLIACVTSIVIIAEFSSGAVSEFTASKRQKDSASSQDEPKLNRENITRRTLTPQKYDNWEFPFAEGYSFNWQRPPSLGFDSVGGFDDVKDYLYRRVIQPLKSNKESYHRFRVSPPTGILLYGPPGTGKTYLARAIAGELGSPYVELSQADLTSKWVNESPSMVRRLFEEAEEFEFSVIFIDEIDGLVRSRGSNAHNEDSKVVSEFLARLADDNPNYLIIAATNRPDQLDSAVLRPGRFEEQFEIGLPKNRERTEIFKVQLRGRNPSLSEFEYREIGARSEGCTAAEITSIVDRAALRAAQRDAESITLDDLLSGLT